MAKAAVIVTTTKTTTTRKINGAKSSGTVTVGSYTRTVNGKTIQVSGYTRKA